MTRTSPSLLQSQVITALIDARRAVLAAAAGLPASARGQAFLGIWSIHELLAHLTGWDHTNLQSAQEVMAGQVPSFYQHRDRDWATYNAMLVEKYKHGSFEDLLAQAERSHQQVVEFLQSLPAQAFTKDFGVRFRGYKVTIARLVEAEAKDEMTHCEQILAFQRSLNPAPSVWERPTDL